MEGEPAVTAAASYSRLRALHSPVITTGEAAAALRVSTSAASRSLRTLAEQGLAQRIRYGLWNLEPEPIDPRRLASEITRPYPSYVSFESALSAHGMIDQLPRDISLASLDRAKRVKTSFATYVVRHLPPGLFGGYEERNAIPLATPEKALFDYFYVAYASAHPRRRLPELELPDGFSWAGVRMWLNRIRSTNLRRRIESPLIAEVTRAGGKAPPALQGRRGRRSGSRRRPRSSR